MAPVALVGLAVPAAARPSPARPGGWWHPALVVTALILHTLAGRDAGPLTRHLEAVRSANADHLASAMAAAGASVHRVDVEPTEHLSFGSRVASMAVELAASDDRADAGCVIAGSGAAALAQAADLEPFVRAARDGHALANNRYSADIVAVPDMSALAGLPGLSGDNALPRWLTEVAGIQVGDLRRRWRLQVDLDSPIDLLLVERGRQPSRRRRVLRSGRTGDPAPIGAWQALGSPIDVVPLDGSLEPARARLDAIARALADRRSEVLVAGRTSFGSLRVLETRAPARIRAWIEERGMRASTPLARAPVARASQRPVRSVLGLLLDRDGPGALGRLVAQLADAAVVDTRVLLAHRLGIDETGWPSPEDRFASDLLLTDRIGDPWLRELTEAAAEAPVPIALGGHTLVGPGSRLLLADRRATATAR